ncbi:MAG: site-specific integrase, partial [Candidatus Sabulitectum sp.]|nr:site-specific integrase [Candidatus Sabulitectum sp.]
MNELIELYRQELALVACYKDNTVSIYVDGIYKFFIYAAEIKFFDPLEPRPGDLTGWLTGLKQSGISFSRLQHYQISLKSFFTFA